MKITAAQVKELRDATSAGMMACKKALTECDGDIAAAKLYLQKKGIADSKKRASRKASEGLVVVQSSGDGRTILMLELNCETDFVARNDDFSEFATGLANFALETGAENTVALLELERDGELVGQQLLQQSGKIGEKIELSRFDRITLEEGVTGTFGSYIHAGGNIGVIIAFSTTSGDDAENGELQQLGKDISMHIAASDPSVVSSDEIDGATLDQQRDIFEGQAIESGKPPEIAKKMVVGRLQKWKKEISLLDQPYVKNTEQTVEQHIAQVSKDNLSGPAAVLGFVRYLVGGGDTAD